MVESECYEHGDAIRRMSDQVKGSHFDLFKSLIDLILAQEAQSDEKMYQFINEEFNTPSSQPLYTPKSVSTGTTPGLMNSSTSLTDVFPMLQRELEHLMYNDVPLLVERFIQQHHPDSSLLPEFIELDSLLHPYEELIKQKVDEISEDTTEVFVLDWITPLLESISADLKEKNPDSQHSRTWRFLPNTPLKGVVSKRKVDCVIMSQYIKDQYPISDVLVPAELKKQESDGIKAAGDLIKYVYEIFNAQPTRSYVVGFTLCGFSMQLWKFDRSGAIGSQAFNIKDSVENLKRFLSLIIIFLTSNKQVLGFDPTFFDIDGETSTPPPQKIQISTAPNPQELVICRLKFRARGICGRGTTCWEAHLLGDKDQKFLIKDSWQPTDRHSEGDMLRGVTKRGIPHVARYHHHQDVEAGSKTVKIDTYVREDLKFMDCQAFQLTSQPDQPGEPKNSFINRTHRRLILKDVGQPIWKVKTPVRLLEALEHCIEGHRALWLVRILHRDISVNNLMINDQADDPDRTSFLIDLDHAIDLSLVDDQTHHHARAGTKVFMSANVLAQEEEHNFVDDLESFFWVFIWICMLHPVKQRKNPSVVRWNQMDPEDLKHIKRGCLANPQHLTNQFTPLFKESAPLIDCVHKFAEIMRDPLVREEAYAATLYDRILKLFQQAQGKI
ncbi:hypothetical protein KEM48_013971 [Puccinia striiformis f. sp. tritici PST-130]|nr:hypothetical protein KEM48_013971 [Puccinia striiformis f. sp. tritici PST-130]